MDNPQFNVVVDGGVLDGFDADVVLVQLRQQLNLPEATARSLIAGKIVTVKRNADAADADAYCERLQALGMNARVEAMAAPALGETPAVDSAAADSALQSRAQRYFSDAALSARDTRNSSVFKRAVMRANAACFGAVTGYLILAAAALMLSCSYAVHYLYLLSIPPILFSVSVYALFLLLLLAITMLILRPLLPRRAAAVNTCSISPLQEPALIAFVAQLCESLTLKPPEQIALHSATINTCALLPGLALLKRGDYRLTLSLPLLENASLTQFGALLAADLATQARPPVLRYRLVATLFTQRLDACLKNEDWLALRLERLAQSTSTRLSPLFDLAALAIEQSNRALRKVFSHMQAIETRLQRPLLFEQDRFTALIAGADALPALMILRAQLDAAAHDANAKNIEDRVEGGLVNDLTALIRHYFEGADENFARALRRKWEAETTPRRNEPPIARERIEAIADTNATALIDDAGPAEALLQNRDDIALQVTLDAYNNAGMAFHSNQLMPVDELMYAATQDILQKQQAVVYFNDWLKPFRFWNMADYKLICAMPLQDAAVQLSVCVNEIRRLTPDRAKWFSEYERLQNQLREILIAQHVLAAGKKFVFRYINFDGITLVPLLEDRQQQLGAVMKKLFEQETVMGGRITLGLRLCGQSARELQALHEAMRLLYDFGGRLYKLDLDCFQLEQLLQRHYQLREADYSLPIKKLETKIDDTCTLLIVRLNDIPYPFDSRHRSLKSFVETVLAQPRAKHRSPILQRAQYLIDIIYRINEKLSRQAAEYGTISEEAYRIEPIRLIGNE